MVRDEVREEFVGVLVGIRWRLDFMLCVKLNLRRVPYDGCSFLCLLNE